MSDYRNEEGEYLMTAAELRLEWELDQQSEYERSFEIERWQDEYEEMERDIEDCDHGDGSHPAESAGFTRESGCGTEFLGPHMPLGPGQPEWLSGGFFTCEGNDDGEADFGFWGNEDAYIDASEA